jgi:hypothetical protein
MLNFEDKEYSGKKSDKPEAAKIPVDELLSRRFSRFPKTWQVKKGKVITLRDFMNEIHSKRHAPKVASLRDFMKEIHSDSHPVKDEDDKEMKKIKSQLPCVQLSGVGGNRTAGVGITEHSGLLQLDFDLGNNKLRPEEVREILKKDRHVVAVFTSPSGGTKGIVPIPRSEETHKDCFEAARLHYEALGLTMDGQPKSPKSLCYVPHDPDIWLAKKDVEVLTLPATLHSNIVHSDIVLSTKNKDEPSTQLVLSGCSPDYQTALDLSRAKREVAKLVEAFKQSPDSDPNLVALYEEYFEGDPENNKPARYQQDFGKRNERVVDWVGFAFQRMTDSLILSMGNLTYDLYRPLIKDSRAVHEKEMASALKGMEESFLQTLNGEDERTYYLEHNPTLRAAFRICRSLAEYEIRKYPPPIFYLSCRELGERLELSHTSAINILKDLTQDGVLKVERPGIPAENGRTTVYKWMFSYEKLSAAA